MLFIRTTLLLGLGVLILPTDQASQARVYDSAKSAVRWTTTFCERNPGACAQGQQAWGVFVKKAEFGLKMTLDLINERGQRSAVTAPAQPTQPAQAAPKRPGTLSLQDLAPDWRGRPARTGG